MLRVLILVFVLFGAVPGLLAERVVNFYPGKLLRTEVLAKTSNLYLMGKFVGLRDGALAFQIERMDRQRIREQPYFERLRVINDRGDESGRSLPELVAGEELKGDIVERENIVNLGPVKLGKFRYLDVASRTDREGILRDQHQVILSLFEDRRHKSSFLRFTNDEYGVCELALTRTQLDDKLGIVFGAPKGSSCPETLALSYDWDRPFYRPGDVARLTATVAHGGGKCGVFQLQGRSMSRQPWMEGKMFYIGDLQAGESRAFTRVFSIPEKAPAGIYFLRIGFKDYSGAKPQLPVRIDVRK